MPSDSLKVGVITANYNQGGLFYHCLEGILKQTRKPNYYVIVDDGSTDESWHKIIRSMYALGCKAHLPFDKSVHEFKWDNIDFLLLQLQKNGGPSNARNIALQALDGKADIAAIADADDIYYPEKINKSVEVMKKYPEVALVYTDYDIEDINAGVKKREYKEPFNYKRLFQECIVSNNSIFALQAAKQVGGYDLSLRYGEDYDLWLRIADIGSLYHIPEALYNYRITGKNVTVVTPPEQFANHVARVHQKALERRSRRSQ